MSKLSEEDQQNYRKLSSMLDDASVKKLEQDIRHVDDLELGEYIRLQLEGEQNYKKLLELLPADQSTALKMQVEKVKSLAERRSCIDEWWSTIRIFNSCDEETKRYYMGLIKALPKEEANQLKVAMRQCDTKQKIDALVRKKLPKKIQDLDHKAQAQIIKLSPDALAKILQQASPQQKKKDVADPASPVPKTPDEADPEMPETPDEDGEESNTKDSSDATDDEVVDLTKTASTTDSMVDIEKIIADELEKDEEKEEDDGWGDKLPLSGKERKAFLSRTICFEADRSSSDALKELFRNTPDDNIANFLTVYNKDLTQKEGDDLLKLMIALYKVQPTLTLRLSNTSKPIGSGDKLTLLRTASISELKLLLKLQGYLLALQQKV
ncbi:MAG: hypothetical protein K2X94_00020 [Amoebophilaceae bacterium]|nr:hypothetical protein [Amoebophilaceae bacterium]